MLHPTFDNNAISFNFRFPKNEERRKLWLVKMKRDGFNPSATAVLCSDHFEEHCFDRSGQATRLRDDAVPTIFDFPEHLQKVSINAKILPMLFHSVCEAM